MKVIANVGTDNTMVALWREAWGCEPPRFRVAWKNEIPNLSRMLQGLIPSAEGGRKGQVVELVD